MLLVIIDGKRVYDNLEFEDDQVGHHIKDLFESQSLFFKVRNWCYYNGFKPKLSLLLNSSY